MTSTAKLDDTRTPTPEELQRVKEYFPATGGALERFLADREPVVGADGDDRAEGAPVAAPT